ncbi:MAG: SAM-dependent methyltransferase [Candidatus Binatus sp.]|uniref:SAM-dependent methyltransferase n=1 Tax=Candidatus Binatus sp. TaxID=2811406 RepID=UPI00271A29A2|nr:SAM-dependent methyltransferase [Candidatus Binatus sp.]MDO8431614.1 SAM-dependent methyltransferase [Candidatus Binatus sp.]
MSNSYARFPALLALVEAVDDPYGRVDTFDRDYAVQADHWGYSTNPTTAERIQRVLNLLDSARAGRRFGRVLEIACAEGVFTELLASRCDSILAVDFSEIALERARARRDWEGRVTFSPWNLRTDPIPGQFDLIVVMDVLSCLRSPARLHAAIDKIVAAMRPGDLVLACDYREDKDLRSLETSRIGKWLLFGGKWVIETFVTDPALEVIATDQMDTHFFALLRKK